ncbi:MAG TPA: MFS transporter [Sphingomonas sp.]|uniref:MFS transporter n=1 Tax=Sphingomonas sp. TaxID=28214 RepID=UPI002BBF325F|nr:MFS transporter [Sphingomonas sp.]HMI17988.1 MFS transporter [Sphingomonas sp.]
MQRNGNWIVVLSLLCFAELAGSLETTLVFATLPSVIRRYGDPIAAAWLVTGFFLVAGASSALCGRLGDLFGRSRVLVIVLAIATAGSVLSATATNLWVIILGRSIQGTAGALLPLCYGLAREHLPAPKLPFGLAAVTAIASLGAAAGFLVGGAIVDHWQWQDIFTVSAVLGGAALCLCILMLPASRPVPKSQRGADLLGGVLFAPAVGLVLLGINQFSSAGLTMRPLLIVAAGIAILAVWVRHELRQEHPLIDIRLLAQKPVALANVNALLVALGTYQVMQIFPILIQQPRWTGIGFGLSATMTGLLKVPSNIASALGALWAGRLARFYGGQSAILVGAILGLFAWLGLLLGRDNLWLVLVLVSCSSAGVVVSLTGTIAVIVDRVPAERTSEATGVTMVLRMMFQALGAQIVAAIFAAGRIGAAAGKETYLTPSAVVGSLAFVVAVCICTVLNAEALRRSIRPGPPTARAGDAALLVGEPQ